MSTVFEFVNFSPNAVVLIDTEIKIPAASKQVYTMFGLPSLISGRKKGELTKLFNTQGRLIDNLRDCLKTLTRTGSQHTFTWQFRKKIYFVSVVAIRVDRTRYYSINFEDVSYKYNMDSPLELTRAYLNDILNNLPLGVIVLDKDQHIYMLNSKQLGFFRINNSGAELENYLGFQLSECLTAECSHYMISLIDNYLAGDKKTPLQNKHKVGELVFNNIISSFSLTDDKNQAIMIITEDITEANALEEKLRISEEKATQLKTLKEINVSIRHEIFNVVTPLSMNAELVKTCLNPAEQAIEIEMIDSILQSTHRLVTFVKQLSDIKEITSEIYIDGDDSSMISY